MLAVLIVDAAIFRPARAAAAEAVAVAEAAAAAATVVASPEGAFAVTGGQAAASLDEGLLSFALPRSRLYG